MVCQAVVAMLDLRGVDDDALGALLPWLGEAEQARCQRFGRAQRRRQFIAGRALARLLLGELCGVAPALLPLQDHPGQGPVPAGAAHGAGLSISHSGPLVAVAVSGGTALGLDIEWIDAQRALMAIAAHAFDSARASALAALPPDALARAFYQMWSEHEATIKLGRAAAHSVALFHQEVSLVLCAAAPLDAVPVLRHVGMQDLFAPLR